MKRHWWLVSAVAALSVPCALPSCERSDRADRWLSFEVERPEPVPSPTAAAVTAGPDSEGMLLRTFRVPESLFFSPESFSNPADPFTPSEGRTVRFMDPQDHFERAGISFGPGAYARGNPTFRTVTVRQTPDQMELVEAYMSGGGGIEPNVTTRIEIFELPSAMAARLVRSAFPHRNHAPEHTATMALLREGRARLVQSVTLPSRSGQRAINEDGYELDYPVPPKRNAEPESPGFIRRTGQEMPRRVGIWLEADSYSGADQITVALDLRLEFHADDPIWQAIPPGSGEDAVPESLHPRFQLKTLHVDDVLESGEIRLVGIWNPDRSTKEKGRRLDQIVFLQIFVFPIDTPPTP